MESVVDREMGRDSESDVEMEMESDGGRERISSCDTERVRNGGTRREQVLLKGKPHLCVNRSLYLIDIMNLLHSIPPYLCIACLLNIFLPMPHVPQYPLLIITLNHPP